MFIAACVSYAGTFILGMPIYSLLKAMGLTTVWVAGTTGFVIGVLMWLVFAVLFVVLLDEGLAGVRFVLTTLTVTDVLWPGSVLGMTVGVLLWLIARPDKSPVTLLRTLDFLKRF